MHPACRLIGDYFAIIAAIYLFVLPFGFLNEGLLADTKLQNRQKDGVERERLERERHPCVSKITCSPNGVGMAGGTCIGTLQGTAFPTPPHPCRSL